MNGVPTGINTALPVNYLMPGYPQPVNLLALGPSFY
jgi:hypothetical protein